MKGIIMREELIERIIDLTIKYQVFSDENTKSIQRNLLGDELLTDYIFCIAKLIDETGAEKIQEILSWYVFDNNFGKNKKRLYINGEYQIIDNSRKLLNILKKETI